MSTVRPGMSDARCFTQYTSSWQMNAEMMKKYNLKTSSEYREFVKKNGGAILQEQRKINVMTNYKQCDCNNCILNKKPFDVTAPAIGTLLRHSQ